MSTPVAFDAIVVGGGIGGLTCGAFLAKAGQRTLLVEQSAVVGGCCSSFRAGGYQFDAAVHHVSGGGARSLIGTALRSVGASVRFARLDPMDRLSWPDLRFDVPGHWDAFLWNLVTAFPHERRSVEALFTELLRLYRATLGTPGGGAVFDRWQDTTFLEFVTSFVDDDRVARILGGQWGYLGSPPARLSTVGMCQMLVNYWRDGAHYPFGGTQALADALVVAIESSGGLVRTSAGARQILVERGRATGVVLVDGTVATSDAVVSNVDVPNTLPRLLGFDPFVGVPAAPTRLEISPPFVLVYLGVDGGFRAHDLPRGFYHAESNFDGPWLYVSSATEVDPTLAPPGRHAFTIVVSLNEDEANATDWPGRKDEKVRATICTLDDHAPGFARHVEVARAAHPPQPGRRSSNFCGAPYGWAVIPGQSGPRRLENTTPVGGLYQTGHWAQPGPGVCAVMASGWRVANEIVRDSGNRAQPSRGFGPQSH